MTRSAPEPGKTLAVNSPPRRAKPAPGPTAAAGGDFEPETP